MEKKIAKCFMNGKSCIYERVIDEKLQRKNGEDKKAFVVMPFHKKMNALYQWEIMPFLQNGGGHDGEEQFKCKPERANDVSQVGYIICEKICKRIQEANVIVVDVSYDNANVFYEFGLAIALRKKILPICLSEKLEARSTLLKERMGIGKIMPYNKFDLLESRISDYIVDFKNFEDIESINGNALRILHNGEKTTNNNDKNSLDVQSFSYNFGSLCKTAAGNAIANIFSEENKKKNSDLKIYSQSNLREIMEIGSIDLQKAKFTEVIESLKRSACVLIEITENINSNFFWLGYIHGIGGNAIPINSSKTNAGDVNVVPFDIRALWHIVYEEDDPLELSNSIKDILEFIYLEKAKFLNRHSFWSKILNDAKVSIFLGSYYLDDLGRNTIGDWDYRTAAEITSFLTSQKETIKVTLESPLPKKSDTPSPEYVNWLKGLLRENSIIVASADVNDLTEIALCEIYKKKPFQEIDADDTSFTGYIAYKAYSKKVVQPTRNAFYYRAPEDVSTEDEERGFLIREGANSTRYTAKHEYPGNSKDAGPRNLLGQLVVAKNPFADDKWIVIIAGISGPATLGIAQMLTGCMYKEFTVKSTSMEKDKSKIEASIMDYKKGFLNNIEGMDKSTPGIEYDSLSEKLIGELLQKSEDGECNALVNVGVYYPERTETSYSNDERKVIGWNFCDIGKFLKKSWPNPAKLHISR